MWNFAYLQKNIIYASIKTANQTFTVFYCLKSFYVKNHFKKLPFTPFGVRKFLKKVSQGYFAKYFTACESF